MAPVGTIPAGTDSRPPAAGRAGLLAGKNRTRYYLAPTQCSDGAGPSVPGAPDAGCTYGCTGIVPTEAAMSPVIFPSPAERRGR